MSEKIEGVLLADQLVGIELALEEERKAKLVQALKGIYRDLGTWEAEIRKCEARAADLRAKVDRASQRLERIRQGDWNAVPDWNAPKEVGDVRRQTSEG